MDGLNKIEEIKDNGEIETLLTEDNVELPKKQVGEKFLPVGSVVLLEKATKKVMITGFCMTTPDKPDIIFDYSGFLYPEGNVGGNVSIVFNHESIKEICFMGYVDDSELVFKKALKEEIEKGKNNE